jgi:hypothetical protein
MPAEQHTEQPDSTAPLAPQRLVQDEEEPPRRTPDAPSSDQDVRVTEHAHAACAAAPDTARVTASIRFDLREQTGLEALAGQHSAWVYCAGGEARNITFHIDDWQLSWDLREGRKRTLSGAVDGREVDRRTWIDGIERGRSRFDEGADGRGELSISTDGEVTERVTTRRAPLSPSGRAALTAWLDAQPEQTAAQRAERQASYESYLAERQVMQFRDSHLISRQTMQITHEAGGHYEQLTEYDLDADGRLDGLGLQRGIFWESPRWVLVRDADRDGRYDHLARGPGFDAPFVEQAIDWPVQTVTTATLRTLLGE